MSEASLDNEVPSGAIEKSSDPNTSDPGTPSTNAKLNTKQLAYVRNSAGTDSNRSSSTESANIDDEYSIHLALVGTERDVCVFSSQDARASGSVDYGPAFPYPRGLSRSARTEYGQVGDDNYAQVGLALLGGKKMHFLASNLDCSLTSLTTSQSGPSFEQYPTHP